MAALQRGLQRLAKPWWKRRALRVFRDDTGAVKPDLWASIEAALDESEWFVLLASPAAARSQWVGREIAHWVHTRGPDRLLVVVTDGTFAWDKAAGHVDFAASTAAHPALRGVFRKEPRHVDLSWARSDTDLTLGNARFRDQVAQIAAPLHGRSKDDFEGEDVRQQLRTRRIARGVIAVLATLALLASAGGAAAVNNAREAARQRDVARQQARLAIAANLATLASRGDLPEDLALLLAVRSYEMDPTSKGAAVLQKVAVTEEVDPTGVRVTLNGVVHRVDESLPVAEREIETVSNNGGRSIVADPVTDSYLLLSADGLVVAPLEGAAPSEDARTPPPRSANGFSPTLARPRAFEFSLDDARILSLSLAGEFHLWSSADGAALASVPEVVDFAQQVGRVTLLTAGFLQPLDTTTGTLGAARELLSQDVTEVAIAGEVVALGHAGGRVTVAEAPSYRTVFELDAGVGPVEELSLSPSGGVVAASGEVRFALIDVARGSLVYRGLSVLFSARGVYQPTGLHFTPDEQTFLLQVDDGRALTLSLDPRRWVPMACDMAGRVLTPAEWDEYVAVDEYEANCG